jgi:hypothetical protein
MATPNNEQNCNQTRFGGDIYIGPHLYQWHFIDRGEGLPQILVSGKVA